MNELLLKDGDDAQFFTEHHCLELYSSHMGSPIHAAEKRTHLCLFSHLLNKRFLNIAYNLSEIEH